MTETLPSRIYRAGSIESFGQNGRTVRYVLSTPAVGRDRHTVAADAWQLANYQRNPVFLWAHDDSLPPIGRMVEIGDVGGILKGTVEYIERELNPFADTIYQLVRGNYINAVSTSWDPLDWTFSKDKERPGGVDFRKVDLLEVSQVPIPALPAALAEARARGIDTGPVYQWAEQILDRGGMLLVPRNELEELRRAAKMPKPTKLHSDADKRALLRANQAQALERAPKLPKFRRGLYDVAQLASILGALGYAHESAEWEADIEGDESTVPAMLGEALKVLGQALVAMTAEEVAELLAQHLEDDEEMPDGIEERALPAAERAFIAAAKTPRARAWRRAIAHMRAGRTLSASNEQKLEAASGHHERAMKHHRAIGEHHEAVSGHLEELRGIHAKATEAHGKVTEALTQAKENPDQAAEHVKRAMTHCRSVSGHLEAMDEKHRDIADRHADAGDSHAAMGRSVKAAQRCVRSVVDGSSPAEEDDNAAEGDKGEKDGKTGKGADEEQERRRRRARALQLQQPVST